MGSKTAAMAEPKNMEAAALLDDNVKAAAEQLAEQFLDLLMNIKAAAVGDHDDVNKKVHDFCASAMQLKPAPMSYSEYSTPQKPMMPPTSAHNNAHNDSGASAMQLNAAPMSCSEYSTPQKPLMPPASAHNNVHNNADLRARFDAGHFRLQTRDAC